jgi:putative transcriptional regulator
MPSHKGKFLIASPRLRDPNFVKTVILLVQHGDEGALGIVLNRPSGLTVRQATDQLPDTPDGPDTPLHLGGPCAGPLVAIHSDPDVAEIEVLDGIYFTAEKHRVERLLRDGGKTVRFFAGYSGWGAGQLESELQEGSWLLLPAVREMVLELGSDPWGRLNTYATLGGTVPLERIPDDPHLN